MRKRHQEYFYGALRWLEGDCFRSEESVPQGEFSIDCVAVIEQPSAMWAALRPEVGGRESILEHYSRPPRPKDLATARIKALLLHRRWIEANDGLRSPILLVLSCGRPNYLRSMAQPTQHSGVWKLEDCMVRGYFLDLKRLPQEPQWLALRALCIKQATPALTRMRDWVSLRSIWPPPEGRPAAPQAKANLKAEEQQLFLIFERFMEGIMSKEVRMENKEGIEERPVHRLVRGYYEALDEGRRGRAKERTSGRAKGRRKKGTASGPLGNGQAASICSGIL